MTSLELDGLHLARRFRFERVLNEDPQTKTLAVLGQIRASDASAKPAVLILERQAFPPHLFASSPATVDDSDDGGIRIPFADQLRLRETNDIYNWFEAWTATDTLQSTGDSKMTIIYPAAAAHIAKYSRHEKRMIRETASDYKRIVEPYILSLPTSRIKWIYNALDGISEAEHVIYRDEDLILLPDSKWDKVTMENLYLLVLCTDRTIRSIRDLRGDNAAHMRMLKTVRDKIPSILAADRVKFPGFTGSDQLRMFVHYQPTYYHFHVHLAHVQITGHPGMTAGQAILLDTVIESLEIDPLFYTKCSLTYALADTHDLYNLFQQDQS